MNNYEQSEEQATHAILGLAEAHAAYYAQPGDRQAATIALLLRTLELAGGACFIKPQENEDE
jgi:hypothetical protein